MPDYIEGEDMALKEAGRRIKVKEKAQEELFERLASELGKAVGRTFKAKGWRDHFEEGGYVFRVSIREPIGWVRGNAIATLTLSHSYKAGKDTIEVLVYDRGVYKALRELLPRYKVEHEQIFKTKVSIDVRVKTTQDRMKQEERLEKKLLDRFARKLGETTGRRFKVSIWNFPIAEGGTVTDISIVEKKGFPGILRNKTVLSVDTKGNRILIKVFDKSLLKAVEKLAVEFEAVLGRRFGSKVSIKVE